MHNIHFWKWTGRGGRIAEGSPGVPNTLAPALMTVSLVLRQNKGHISLQREFGTAASKRVLLEIHRTYAAKLFWCQVQTLNDTTGSQPRSDGITGGFAISSPTRKRVINNTSYLQGCPSLWKSCHFPSVHMQTRKHYSPQTRFQSHQIPSLCTPETLNYSSIIKQIEVNSTGHWNMRPNELKLLTYQKFNRH
jgi:hypothetical protein